VAALGPAYLPRRPTETALYAPVRQNLESFLAYVRQHYDGGLPLLAARAHVQYCAGPTTRTNPRATMRTMWVLTWVLAALTACGDSNNSAQSSATPPATTDASGQGGEEAPAKVASARGVATEKVASATEVAPARKDPAARAWTARMTPTAVQTLAPGSTWIRTREATPTTGRRPPRRFERSLARSRRWRAVNGNMSADVHVHLLPGTLYMTAPLTLGGADSGTNGFDVWWDASPAGSAILSGGYVLDSATCIGGWTPTTFNTSIYQCKLPSGAAQTPTRDLYVDGVRAQIAHTETPFIPGTGTWITNNGCPGCGPQGGTTGFTIQPGATPDISDWSLEGGTLWLVVEDNWRMHRGPIVQISGNQVIMDSHWWWRPPGPVSVLCGPIGT